MTFWVRIWLVCLHHENPVIFEITGFFRFKFFVGAMQQGVK